MTRVFISVSRYDWCAPLSHPISCMLVSHGPSQQSFKKAYKPWKWGATARYKASHTKTMLPTIILAKIQQVIWPHEDLLTIVKRRKLQWYVHISRVSGLSKTDLQGTVKGGRRQGRQKKRRQYRPSFAKSQRAVEKRSMEETGCEVICGAPTTFAVKG